MKILTCHNYYQSDRPSGENIVVTAEVGLLRQAGLTVVECHTDSDDLKHAGPKTLLTAGIGPVYSATGVKAVEQAIKHHSPDLLHLHNPYPLLSPWIVRTAKRANVPVVQTIHNFRHSCINGLHFKSGENCVRCLGKAVPLAGLQHGCYRGSRLQSIPMVLGAAAHRRTWDLVDRFIAQTPFMAGLLIKHGIQASRISVRDAWVPDADLPPSPITTQDLIFVGRLDPEKGVELLIEAWAAAQQSDSIAKLHVVGDGRLRPYVEAQSQHVSNIVYHGRLDAQGIDCLMRSCACLVAPSLCFEGYGLVIAEAFARGRPVITVTGGSMATIVGPDVGWVAERSVRGLAAALRQVTIPVASEKGRAARRQYETRNSPDSGLRRLLEIYTDVTSVPHDNHIAQDNFI